MVSVRTLAFLIVLGGQLGCAVVGTVKPVDEKSASYGVVDLAKESPDWLRLDAAEPGDTTASDSAISDVAYQHRKDPSTISLNSSCRAGNEGKDLKDVARQLHLGFTDVTLRTEKPTELQGEPAIETTTQGKPMVEGHTLTQDMMLRTFVVRRGRCIYDLMYIARADQFSHHAEDFERFVASLKLR